MLLSILEVISNMGSPDSLLSAMISVIIALLAFAVAKKWYGSYRFRKHPAWSFVQPFEE